MVAGTSTPDANHLVISFSTKVAPRAARSCFQRPLLVAQVNYVGKAANLYEDAASMLTIQSCLRVQVNYVGKAANCMRTRPQC